MCCKGSENLAAFINWFLLEFNRTFIVDNRWRMFVTGFKNTLTITLIAALIGVVLGVFVSVIQNIALARKGVKHKNILDYPLIVLSKILNLYVSIMRGTPLAVQLMIASFVVLSGMSNKVMVAAIAFGVNSGAYVAEVIRGGINAVDKGQLEAGRSIGLGYIATMWFIILPQAIKGILPSLCNEGIAILKETSIVGLISVVDLTRASDLVRSRTLSPFFPLISVALVYFVLVAGLSYAVSLFEKRLARSDRS